MKLTKLIERKLNNNFFEKRINHFFKEVIDDIKILNNYELYLNNPNPTVAIVYNNQEVLNKIKENIGKRYKKEYCPTNFFEYFNQSERMKYLLLRMEMDKILGIKGNTYKI
jgi:hypothetical protein